MATKETERTVAPPSPPSLYLFLSPSCAFCMYIIPELTQKTNSSEDREAAQFESAAGLHVSGASAEGSSRHLENFSGRLSR